MNIVSEKTNRLANVFISNKRIERFSSNIKQACYIILKAEICNKTGNLNIAYLFDKKCDVAEIEKNNIRQSDK